MKVNVSEEEWKLFESVIFRGALEGAVASAAVSIPGFYYLHRKSAWYRSLPLPLRVAGVVMVVAPLTSIQAERRSLEFERKQWCVVIRVRAARPTADPIAGLWIWQVGFRKTRTGSRCGGRRSPV